MGIGVGLGKKQVEVYGPQKMGGSSKEKDSSGDSKGLQALKLETQPVQQA